MDDNKQIFHDIMLLVSQPCGWTFKDLMVGDVNYILGAALRLNCLEGFTDWLLSQELRKRTRERVLQAYQEIKSVRGL